MTREAKRSINNVILVVTGSLFLAIGVSVFLIPCNLVTGGVSGLAIILTKLTSSIFKTDKLQDIYVVIITWILFFVGLLFVGKKFSLKTLLSTIFEPIFVLIITRTNIFNFIIKEFVCNPEDADFLIRTLFASIFGSVFVGAGVALTFLGGGSTGGFDVFSFIFFNLLSIPHSVTSFVIDAIIIFIGMFIMDNLMVGFIGIIGAFIAALMIQYIFAASGTIYQAEIITDKTKEVLDYIHNEMSRGTTIVDAVGGYTDTPKKLIKVSFDKTQFQDFKNFLGKTDPNAFIIFTQLHQVFGEGFRKIYKKDGRK